MTEKEFRELKEGDIVRHKSDGKPMIVTGDYGKDAKIITRTETLTNPIEWDVIVKQQPANRD